MKWPESLTLIRHDTSAYNDLKSIKDKSPLYQEFKKQYDQNPESEVVRKLAVEVQAAFSLKFGDHNTPLKEGSGWQAKQVGEKLKDVVTLPDVIFVSPYLRTQQTLENIMLGWPDLKSVPIIEEERIREQDHGLALIYNDWRVFNILHPGQKEMRDLQGEYWYRYPQGENIPDVRERLRSWLTTLTRDFSEQNVLSINHHLTILALRANLERLGEKEFLHLDENDKPINAGVTIYRGDKNQGVNGKLLLDVYNLKLYT